MLVLASQSATRKALLAGAGIRFEACPAQIDERQIEAGLLGKPAAEVALRLAEAKALAVSLQRPGDPVVGSDQVLALDDRLLHKPSDLAAARVQLEQLRDRAHQLHCGVALVRDGRVLWSHVESARLRMRTFSADELEQVLRLEGDAVLSSVGGYRLEGPSIRLFASVEGDYFTILGLPLLALLQALRTHAPETLSP